MPTQKALRQALDDFLDANGKDATWVDRYEAGTAKDEDPFVLQFMTATAADKLARLVRDERLLYALVGAGSLARDYPNEPRLRNHLTQLIRYASSPGTVRRRTT